jgi:hypothetical protein
MMVFGITFDMRAEGVTLPGVAISGGKVFIAKNSVACH